MRTVSSNSATAANGARKSPAERSKPAPRFLRRPDEVPRPAITPVALANGRSKPEPRGDFAYRVLRDAIRSGRIVPGEHLRETEIAQWLRMSRTPVREAFHRLISESLLSNGRWNGVMVADLDIGQVRELYAVRESLEGTAAHFAARYATNNELEAIDEVLAREAKSRTKPKKCVALNRDLHELIYRAAHNRYLLQSLNSVVDALGLLYRSTFVLPGSIDQAHREHVKIVAAIKHGNAAEAESLAREHVRHSLQLRLQLHATSTVKPPKRSRNAGS